VEEFHLKTKIRDITGKKVKRLRSQGLIPAVLYGHGIKPENLAVAKNDLKKIFAEAGTSSLITLETEGKAPVKVLAHEPQFNQVSDEPIHIDFYKVRMDEKIKTEIPLEFVGESEAVKQLDGSLVTNRDNIEIECLPTDLIPSIEVDISTLKTFEDQISVKDIKVPEKIEVLTDKDEVIAFVEPPRSEEELAELETPTAAEEEKEAIEQMEAEAERPEGEKGEEEALEEGAPESPVEEKKSE
jgi:large subunit ribosomal protein L25